MRLCAGWRAFLSSYNTQLSKRLIPEQFDLIQELVEWLLPPVLDFLSQRCRHFVNVGDIHQFHVRSHIDYLKLRRIY